MELVLTCVCADMRLLVAQLVLLELLASGVPGWRSWVVDNCSACLVPRQQDATFFKCLVWHTARGPHCSAPLGTIAGSRASSRPVNGMFTDCRLCMKSKSQSRLPALSVSLCERLCDGCRWSGQWR